MDESTGVGVSEKLKQMGFDSVSVIEIMKGAEDIDVIKRAKRENRIIVTNDERFRMAGNHLQTARSNTP